MKIVVTSLFVLCVMLKYTWCLSLRPVGKKHNSHLKMVHSDLESTMISLAAGSIAGSLSVGLAYPLDSIKTRIQELSADSKAIGLWKTILLILREEGLGGFYRGVWGVMVGQAVIIAVAFTTNAYALQKLSSSTFISDTSSSLATLIIAGMFSGFITAFFVNPIERIKINLQTDTCSIYENQFDCMQTIWENDKFGLLFRGIDATLIREVPGYALYFAAYAVLMRAPYTVQYLGFMGPIINGALAGVISWLPIYPFDVIKTTMQNTKYNGDQTVMKNDNFFETAKQLNEQYGLGIFYTGITPKLLKAIIVHGAEFWIYDTIVRNI